MTPGKEDVKTSSETWNVFPIGLIAVTLLTLVGFQTFQLYREREALTTVQKNQESPLKAAAKLRVQLTGLARDTAVLADQGNKNARAIKIQLARSGINIHSTNANASPVEGAKANK